MQQKLDVCIIEDENILRITLRDELKENGYNVNDFDNPVYAVNYIIDNHVDVVISDIKMPYMNGQEVLKKIKTAKPEIEVILITAYGTINDAVNAVKAGAYDYVTKPFEIEKILFMVERIGEFKIIKKENKQLREQLESQFDFSSFVGSSKAIKNIFKSVELVANTNSTVLINGETGTGKEMLTNIIHYNSNRKKQPFIKVSCAILSKEIFESELFGHEKGAFTGADKIKIGRFELADKGTLYLDDIDDIPLNLQVKLLRAIEQQDIERVGGSETIKIDVRIIASTKINLKKLVDEGKFREDLYYRLNVFPITIPPLKERKEDIPELVYFFIKLLGQDRKIIVKEEAMQIIMQNDWRGNVRELKNFVERLILLASDNVISIDKIPLEFRNDNVQFQIPESLVNKPLTESLDAFEINILQNAIEKSHGNKSKAAELLGIPLSTLRSKLQKYNLDTK